jgi:hypothetical protein
MNTAESKIYWLRVAQKLDSPNSADRNWAAHVLATALEPAPESNLTRALQHLDSTALTTRLRELAAHDADATTVTYAEAILAALQRRATSKA